MKTRIILAALALVASSTATAARPLASHPQIVQQCDRIATAIGDQTQNADAASAAMLACTKGAEDGLTGNRREHENVIARYDAAQQDRKTSLPLRMLLPRLKMARNMGYHYGQQARNRHQ